MSRYKKFISELFEIEEVASAESADDFRVPTLKEYIDSDTTLSEQLQLSEIQYKKLGSKKGIQAITEKGTEFIIYPSVRHVHTHHKKTGQPIHRQDKIWKAALLDKDGNVSPDFYDVTSKSLAGIKQVVERYVRYKNL